MTIRLNGRYIAGNAQKTNSDWNATSGYAQILNKPTNLAHTTGNETISGIKTFATIPLIPTASTSSSNTETANTLLVDNKITAHDNGNNAHSDIRNSISTLESLITGKLAPNYSNGISITSSGYTAPSNGWICYSLYVPDNTTSITYINNIKVGAMFCTYAQSHTQTLFVKQNDIFSFTGGSIRTNTDDFATFFPCLGNI